MKKFFISLFLFSALIVVHSITTSVLVLAQDITPGKDTTHTGAPVLVRDLPNTTGGTTVTLIVILVGLAFYWMIEWRKKVKREGGRAAWRVGTWLGDNWFTIILYVVGTIILYYNAGAMHPIAAFMLGMSPAAIIDWVKKEGGSTT